MGAFANKSLPLTWMLHSARWRFFLLLLFLYCQQYLDVHHLVKVASDPIELGGDVIAQGWGNFEVVPLIVRFINGSPCAR